jgi:hypothetical protein
MTIELAFASHAFERLFGILDPVLMLVAIRREQLHDLEGSVRGGPVKGTCDVTDRLPHHEFMRFQHTDTPSNATGSPYLRQTALRPEFSLTCCFIAPFAPDGGKKSGFLGVQGYSFILKYLEC